MHKAYFGANRQEMLDWLKNAWLMNGPPICFLEGFPGVGKSVLADEVLAHVKHLQGWHVCLDVVTDRARPSVINTFFDLADKLGQKD